MAKLVILTVDPADPLYGEMWPPFFERLAAPLRAAGLTVEPAAWTGALPEADAYCPLMAWGYHKAYPQWRTFLDGMDGARLINPASTVRWNADKAYLLELSERGAAIPPTVSVEHASAQAVELAIEGFGVEEVVVKPRVSAGAFQTVRVRRGEPMADGPEGPALIQPFLPAVAREGEWSLFWFGDRFSHAVTKVAAEGDFRVQPQFGGLVQAKAAPDAARKAAEAVLGACPHPWTYARVDLIADGGGGYALMELELIEPHLFLDEAGDGGAAFGEAMRAAVAG